MASTPSLAAQIEAVRALIDRYVDGKYQPPETLAAVLVTLQQHEHLEAALRLMLTHGERCNWFADRGDEEVCDKARAALDSATPETPTEGGE